MPELHPSLPGLYCAGQAGDGGVVSTNGGRVVLGPSAGNVHWYQGTEALCQYYAPGVSPRLVAVDILTGQTREVLVDGILTIISGSGHWFAITMHSGVLLDGSPVTYSLRAFAGEFMAWFQWNGTGLDVKNLTTGENRHLSDVLGPGGTIQLFPDGGVIWGEGGEIRSDGVSGCPTHIPVVPGGFGWQRAFRIGGTWWVTYQSYALAAVVAHPVTELRGYAWPAPNAFFLDAGLLTSVMPRIVWSRSAADLPQDVEVHDVDLSAPRIDLIAPVPVPIPVPPVPVPEPPKPHMEDKSHFVLNHPMRSVLGTPKGPGLELQRAYNSFRFVCAVARDLGPSWGVQKKGGGDFLPVVNGQGYWGDGLRTRTGGVDIVNNREGEGASPGWSNPQDDGIEIPGFAAPPSDADIVQAMGGTPEPTPDPPKLPPSDSEIEKLWNKLWQLDARHEALAGQVNALLAQNTELISRVTVLEQKPALVTLPKLRVRGRTSTSLYHNHTIDLDVVPE